ncbi:MAG: peptidylprolyl isomerase [Bacteroidetes bacterium]|jgi:peptidyl-prolyl cis-trans isomerase SurA|nr:peptidylprolyl isomerase [Bacteroidota bacterium]
MRRIWLYFILFITISPLSFAQEKIIDQIVAVVGDRYVLHSDVENQLLQMQAQGASLPGNARCTMMEEIMVQKLLANQAEIDSIIVGPGQVEMQLEQRMQYFINQIGSRQALEEYFGKSILEIKEDMREMVHEQLLTQKMQTEIAGDVSVTPSEVKDYYNNLHEDSIPYVSGTVQISQIVIDPPYGEKAILEVRQRLLDLRKRILEGESFTTLAVLYSEGPSSSKGGEIGFAARSDLDPEYAKVAFSMREGQVSKIVESDFGYHIIQMIERRDDRVNTRHILMRPKVSQLASKRAIHELDSIVGLLKSDSITFEQAAYKFSDDENSRLTGGKAVNPQTGNHKWEMDHFRTQDYYAIKDLEVGEISEPYESIDRNENKVYKIVKIESKTPPHTANLKNDYHLFKQSATQAKQQKIFQEWIAEKLDDTYVQVIDEFQSCDFEIKGWIK